MKKQLMTLLFSVLTVVLFISCASVPREAPSLDGVYSYDFERYVDCVEYAYTFQSYGMDAYQNILKKSWGNAVYIQDGTFVEPETGILISIAPDGQVSSPDNPSINGTYDTNGDFFFQGYYEENGQVVRITINGTLLYSADAARASKAYDGNFVLVDNGTERKQNVTIENGLYIWEYQDKQDDDFTTWPTIVNADGSIHTGFEMTVRSGIRGLSEMLVSSTNESSGKVTPSGSIQLQTITQSYGTGQSGESETITYSGVRGTENMSQITKAQSNESTVKSAFQKRASQGALTLKGTPPEWYSDFIMNDDLYLYGSARKTHDDSATALKIAEITAASQIRSALVQKVATRSESQMTQTQGEASQSESRFFRSMDSFSQIPIPYTVKNSFYDETTRTAYVVVSLLREEGEKCLFLVK
ncbi:MAG: hypothetical protein K6E51_12970 [Treponema sp.]|nr:hypothetical protein [Treponema sp.]